MQSPTEAESSRVSMEYITIPSLPAAPISSEEKEKLLLKKIEAKEKLLLKKITRFVRWLAFYEMTASWLGKLAAFWGTVVLLGGFVATLRSLDIWFVTIIVFMDGVRIFCLSRELQWRHLSDKVKGSARLNRTLQVLTILACIVLSICRLCVGFNYHGGNIMNRNLALNIFYWLSLVEAILVLVEKILFWKVAVGGELPEVATGFWSITPFRLLNVGNLLSEVKEKLKEEVRSEVKEGNDIDKHLKYAIRSFVCLKYSRCINKSILDGVKIKFAPYSVELLQSSIPGEQLAGAQLLVVLANHKSFAEKTLLDIGTMPAVVERLIAMLKWKSHTQQEIRRKAAEIISELVKKAWNRIQVTAVAGSMESIASLLYDSKQIEIDSRDYQNIEYDSRDYQNIEYDYSVFTVLGLRILNSLAIDHDNCAEIGGSRGLLPKIIRLTELNPMVSDSQIETAKLALQLMARLASSTDSTGKTLRKRISEIVFAVSNVRDVLQYRAEISTHDLQVLAIDTLKSLALEEENRDSIGATGGVLRKLLSVFFMERMSNNDETKELVTKAGEALGLLSLGNKQNCKIMMSIKLRRDHPNLIASMISVLHDPVQGIHVARILRNLCAYRAETETELRQITATAAQVVVSVMDKSGPDQEAAIGLAAEIFKFMTKSDFDRVFDESRGVTKRSLISELAKVLRNTCPSKEVPNIRRFSIELLISVMGMGTCTIEMRSELEEALERVMETTSEVESYSILSGTVGLTRHPEPIRSRVQYAMSLLGKT